jgi:hypothetical protein
MLYDIMNSLHNEICLVENLVEFLHIDCWHYTNSQVQESKHSKAKQLQNQKWPKGMVQFSLSKPGLIWKEGKEKRMIECQNVTSVKVEGVRMCINSC